MIFSSQIFFKLKMLVHISPLIKCVTLNEHKFRKIKK